MAQQPPGEQDQEERGRGRFDRGGRGGFDRGDRGGFDRSGFDRGGRGGGDRGSTERRRGWDPSDYLRRIDQDRNGYLDTTEITGRSRGFIEQLGFDTSKPVSVDQIIGKVNSDRAAAVYAERRKELDANRKVPKFGEPSDLPNVADFKTELGGSLAGGEAPAKYDEQITEQVKRIIERYDRNGDGVLDREENRRLRWDSFGVDQNNDGSYTFSEIAEFYKSRDQEARARNNSSRSSNSTSDVRISTSRTPPAAARRATPTRSLDSRVTSYVDNIFKKYDKNGDGKLDKNEMKEVRIPFKDEDKDGEITRDEAMAYVGGQRSSGSSNSSAGNNPAVATTGGRGETKPKEMRRDIRGWTRVGANGRTRMENSRRGGNSEAPREFRENDKNQDGQIQMSEFAGQDEWTDEKLDEYYRYDRDKDGVITLSEWSTADRG